MPPATAIFNGVYDPVEPTGNSTYCTYRQNGGPGAVFYYRRQDSTWNLGLNPASGLWCGGWCCSQQKWTLFTGHFYLLSHLDDVYMFVNSAALAPWLVRRPWKVLIGQDFVEQPNVRGDDGEWDCWAPTLKSRPHHNIPPRL